MRQKNEGLRDKRDAAIRRSVAIVIVVALTVSIALAIGYTIIK